MQTAKKYTDFENRLVKVAKYRAKQAVKLQTDAYRIYDRDLPEFPFIIDKYRDALCVYEYKSKHQLTASDYKDWLNYSLEIIAKTCGVEQTYIYLKTRERKRGEEQYQKLQQQKNEMIVHENGLSFIANLSDYVDTGLFFDQRIARQKIKQLATDKHVLNLFAYTGSFSVYAAAGHAKTITTVDLSKTYLNWARRNLTYNKLYDEKKHFFMQEDTLNFLKNIKEYFDIIICDPPTFSNSKRMYHDFDIQRDYLCLITACLKRLNPGGQLLFSTNKRQFQYDLSELKCTSWKDITKSVIPFDFEGKFGLTVLQIMK